ncbi:MAG: VOC family protein [Propionibacteriaceae bacterium]|jgi:hypothetical protein|nr:VOC family protein [Propionibacteriaceae bacterium]
MALSIGMITTDTTDALGLATWWAERLGGTVSDDNDGWFVLVHLPDRVLAFQKVPDPTPGKNRVHLDLTTDAELDATRDAFLAAGATLVGEREESGFRWVTLADPDGNQFCVAPGE